jgi:4-diphosphocytidyl-2-C-methyl-D-erythritol kinase
LGGTIIGVGRGDVLSKLGDILPTQWLLVVCPRLEIPTPNAYALGQWGVWDEADTLTREELENTIWRFCETAGSEGPEWSWVENDFEGPIFEHYPSLAEIRDRLLRLGCERVLLCGSGGALAALAPPDRLRRVAEAVVKVESAETVLCRTLSRSEYLTALRECGLQAD